MEKLAKFITDNSGEDATEEDKQLVSSATGVYPILIEYFDRLQKETTKLATGFWSNERGTFSFT